MLVNVIESLAMTKTKAESISQGEFEAFYIRTSRALHGYLCRLTRDSATADEVLQEAYIRMINLPALEEAHRKAYLYTAATNIVRDRWRRQKREREWVQLSHASERVYQNFSLPLDMASIFERLSAQERAVLWLAHVEEMSHREIAGILGAKEKSVRVIIFRAREKAKELLQEAGFGVTR
jgi:RNA polymerase sigma-70 factor, ECF subfamily